MGKFVVSQNNFVTGEVGPRGKGRQDLREYNNGLDTLENAFSQKQGGINKRPGTQFKLDLAPGPSFSNANKMIPFVFSQTESYLIAIGQSSFRVFDNSGVEQTINTFIDGLLFPENPDGWKYTQSGDILILFYDNTVDGGVVITFPKTQFSPVIILRTNDNEFLAFPWIHPTFFTEVVRNFDIGYPEQLKFSPSIWFPYRPTNVDPNLRLYVDTATIGTGRNLFAVDSTNTPTPYFKSGHTFNNTGTVSSFKARRIGAFFKVTRSTTTGVCWGEDWHSNSNVPSGDIDLGTDIITITGHIFQTKDQVEIADIGGTNITNYSIGTSPETGGTLAFLSDTTGSSIVHVRSLSANTIALYPTQNDAVNDTNRLDITATTSGIQIIPLKMSFLPVTIESPMEGTLTSAANASDNWEESAWSSERGFPKAGTFHEQRLFMGGVEKQPDTVWGSQVGNIVSFMANRLEQDSSSPTSGSNTLTRYGFTLSGAQKVTDPIGITIASKQANIIQWMESLNVLLIGTIGAEYAVSGGDNIISNESIFVRKQTEEGSANVDAIASHNSVLFIQRDGKNVRDFKFNDTNGSYISINLSLLSDHMVYKGFDGALASQFKSATFREMYWQPSRAIVWLLTSNNELVGVTVNRESNVLSWHYHPTRSTDSILSIAVIPNPSGTFDDLWLLAKRSIDGSDEVYLEKMGDNFEHSSLNNSSSFENDVPFFSDCAVTTILGSATDTVTGLSHLEGETVKVLAAGAAETDKTVASGQITLDAVHPIGTRVVVGLPYTTKITTLDLEAGADFGSSQGAIQRIDRITARLYQSQGGTYGSKDASTYEIVEYDDSSLFTGEKRLHLRSSPDTNAQVDIIHDDPLPFNLLSITYRGVSYD